MNLIIPLEKAEQMGLFGSRQASLPARPPGSGWQAIPAGKHGGFRRRHGTGWEYWYPEKGIQSHPHADDAKPDAPPAEAPRRVTVTAALTDKGKVWLLPASPERREGSPNIVRLVDPENPSNMIWAHMDRISDAPHRKVSIVRINPETGKEEPLTPRPKAEPMSEPEPTAPEPTPEPAKPRVENLVQFAARTGGVTDADVDGHIQAGLRSKPGTKTFDRFYSKRLAELQNQRDITRENYRVAIERGEITAPPEMTLEEVANSDAAGISDERRAAAKRALERRATRRESAAREMDVAPKPPTPPKPEQPMPLVVPERRFETAGKKIGGSRADIAAMSREDLEKNPTLARTLITKSNVIGTWKPAWAEADRDNGVESAAAYAKKLVVDAVAGRPFDSADIREAYRQGATRLLDGLSRCKTLGDIRDFLAEWRDLAMGSVPTSDRVKRDGPFAFDWNASSDTAGWGGGGKKNDYDFLRWVRQGGKATLADHFRAYSMTTNSPSSRNDILAVGGFTGWRENADGTVTPLKPDALQTALYKVWTGAMGNRFAELVGFGVKMRRGKPGIFAHADWAGRPLQSKGRKEFDAEISGPKAGDWSWAEIEKPKPKASVKPEMKTISREDSAWVWTRKTGPVSRKGPPVTPPKDSVDFMKSFGLPGVEYGNWANDAEREWHVTGAHSAMHDLADVLGIPPTDLGIRSRLSLAFGARGTGGKRAPLAHYEPGRQVINITKLNGAGSLAHEWGHFLDHAIIMASDGGGKANFLSEGKTLGGVHPTIAAAMRKVMETIKHKPRTAEEKERRKARRREIETDMERRREELKQHQRLLRDLQGKVRWDRTSDATGSTSTVIRDEAHAAATEASDDYNVKVHEYNALVSEWRSLSGKDEDTEHYATAKTLGGGSYYSKDAELWARAFDSWVEDRLVSQGRHNGYLVQGTREDEPGIFMPPDSDHRKATNAAIDELMTALHAQDQFRKSDWGTWFDSAIGQPRLTVHASPLPKV